MQLLVKTINNKLTEHVFTTVFGQKTIYIIFLHYPFHLLPIQYFVMVTGDRPFDDS